MISDRRFRFSAFPALALSMLALACSGDPSSPGQEAPVITITGVEADGRYTTSRTIVIAVDRGSYTATLNGAPFTSGRVVSVLGSHTLRVVASSGSATTTREVRFTIEAGSRLLIIRMFNLGDNNSGGGGDAILMTDSTSSGMQHGLVDAGPGASAGNDAAYVSQRLASLGVDSLAFMLLTHAHADHYLGMPPVFNVSEVRRFVYNGQVRSAVTYQSLLALAASQADSVIVVTNQRDLPLARDSAAPRFTVIPPLPNYLAIDTDDGTRLNDGSIGSRLSLGTFEMFFTGDGEVEANTRWRTSFAAMTADVDVLKVGHHGANNAIFDNGFIGTSTWLDHTAPTISVISANGRSHPRLNALNRLLQQSNNRTYCTNVHGDIEIRVTQAGNVTVTVQRNANAVCVPGSEANT